MICEYCRAELADSDEERAAHEASCKARAWYLQNFQPAAGAAVPKEAPGTCKHCGWEFAADVLAEHEKGCDQRRWMNLNFEHQGGPPELVVRPPALPRVKPEDEDTIFTLVARMFVEPDERLEKLAIAFAALNDVRDDETFAILHPGATAVDKVWLKIGSANTSIARKAGQLALPTMLRALDRVVALAGAIEADLDQLQRLAPGKIARELAYLEDAEVEKMRGVLEKCGEIESDVAARKSRLKELASHLGEMQRDVENAIEAGELGELERTVKTRLMTIEERMAEPLPKSSPKQA